MQVDSESPATPGVSRGRAGMRRLGCTKKAMLRRAANVPGHLRSRAGHIRSTAGHLRSRAGHPRCPGFIEKKAICPFFSSFIHENPSYVYMRQSASVSNRTLQRFGTLWLQLSGYLAAPAQDMYFYRAGRYSGFHVTIRLCAHCNFQFPGELDFVKVAFCSLSFSYGHF
jgi:hypothetical protein